MQDPLGSAKSVALADETEQQSNRDAEPKSSQHKPSANIEPDGPHHQETNRDKNSGKLRVHSHYPHDAWVPTCVTVLHRADYLTTGRGYFLCFAATAFLFEPSWYWVPPSNPWNHRVRGMTVHLTYKQF